MGETMWRTVLGVIGGLIAWALVVSLINRGLRLWLPGYVQAEPTLIFTLPMMGARLAMAAVTSLAAGAIVRLIAPASRFAPWIVGLVLLAAFVPSHVQLWHKFPIWYHLSFLVPLAPLVVIGAQLVGRARPRTQTG